MTIQHLRITCGTIRALTREEKQQYKSQGYCWVVLTPYIYECDDIKITVPAGFLTDGSSGGGPDYGCSWLFHDWLYANHCFDSDETGDRPCTRDEADQVMSNVLNNERLNMYCRVFNCLSSVNVFYCFSRAWANSGARGPQFLESENSCNQELENSCETINLNEKSEDQSEDQSE